VYSFDICVILCLAIKQSFRQLLTQRYFKMQSNIQSTYCWKESFLDVNKIGSYYLFVLKLRTVLVSFGCKCFRPFWEKQFDCEQTTLSIVCFIKWCISIERRFMTYIYTAIINCCENQVIKSIQHICNTKYSTILI